MDGIVNFETFIVAALLLNLTPGNDTIFVLSKSLASGKKAGIMSAFGIGTGLLIHTSFAAFGLSALISESLLVFNILKYAGAAYLIFLGVTMVLKKSQLHIMSDSVSSTNSLLKNYKDAMYTNILNPKVAFFFIAFLPQFIDPANSNSLIPFFILGLTFTITGTLWCIILVFLSALIFEKINKSETMSSYLNKISGSILILLGLKVAFGHK